MTYYDVIQGSNINMEHVESTNPFDELDDELPSDQTSEQQATSTVNPFDSVTTPIDVMDEHWRSLNDLMSTPITNPFALQEFQEHISFIEDILYKEQLKSSSNDRTNECIELLLSENVLEKIYFFTTRQRNYSVDVRLTILHFFKSLLSLPGPPLFIHQQVLRPLNRMLRVCEMAHEQNLSSKLIPLLHQICIVIQENESFLDLFFTDGAGQVPSKFLVFTLLVPYLHDTSEVGMIARDAMLLCLSVAGRSPQSSLCDFVVADTDFCQVLATGLSALYSSLPTNVQLTEDDWHSPLSQFELVVPELKKFLQTLSYCNSVLQMAPLLVCQAVVSLIKNGFLQQVVGRAILQVSPNEAAVAIGYLCIFLYNINNVHLMRVFLQFVALGNSDDKPVLNCLIQNISSDYNLLASITLELFYFLLNLNCEDIMLTLILRHLLSGQHVMPNQLPTIGNRDLYCVAARKFLQLIPLCCQNAETLYLESLANAYTTTSPQSSRPSSPLNEPSPLYFDSTSPTDLSLSSLHQPGHVRRNSTSSTCSSGTIHSGPLPTVSSSTQSTQLTQIVSSLGSTNYDKVFEYISPDMSYFNYLMECHSAIEQCAKGCQCWSSCYSECIVNEEREVNIVITSADTTVSSLQDGKSTSSHESVNNGTNQLDSISTQKSRSPSLSPRTSPRPGRRDIKEILHPSSSNDRFSDQTGLFLKILLERLSKLLTNSPVLNQLLIKVITRLAYYPHPLIRSLLLNHHLVLKPGVPNLFYVLQDLKHAIDKLARERDNFDTRLGRAKKTMIFKAAVSNGLIDEATAAKISSFVHELPRSESQLSIDCNDTSSPIKGDKTNEDKVPRRRAMTEGNRNLSSIRKRKKKVKFLKELAALSQEHSVLNPDLLQIKTQ